MKKGFSAIVLLIVILLGLAGCKATSGKSETAVQKKVTVQPTQSQEDTKNGKEASASKEGTLVTVDYDSKAISDNQIEENSQCTFYIYLPASYQESTRNYPVLYFLHGFGDSALSFASFEKLELNRIFSENPSKEFILVAIDGISSPGGSFYVNSPVTGRWEDYIVKEVVSYVDSNYRTLADSKSRGICGYSMGGFGALNLAFLHPEVYGAVYAMSPGVLAPGKIGDALDTWKFDSSFLKSYSLAFAYTDTAPYETLPKRDGSDGDNVLLKRWEAGFGNWKEKLDTYLALNTPLRGIGLSYGTGDYYPWIPEGVDYLSGLLDEKGIEHTMYTFDGGHVLPPKAMEDHLLPFFQQSLIWQ